VPLGAAPLAVAVAVTAGAAGVVTAEPSWMAERRRTRQPERGRASPGRRSPWPWPSERPDAGQAVGALSASPVPPWGRPSNRSADVQRPGVRCPGVRCIQVSGRTGLRCPRRCRAVRAALDWSGSCGGPPRVGRSGSTCPVVRGRHGRLHRAGRQGVVRRWPCLARTRLTPAQGRRWAGVPAAGPPGRRADTGAGPGPGCRLGGGGAWDRAGAHQPPQGVLGRSPAPGHGPGPRGGDHATWSLGEGWSRVVRLRRATGFGWGAACGRSTAAAHEERCPLGADRSLTREDSGGRDRV
jgi:hypothetical protein